MFAPFTTNRRIFESVYSRGDENISKIIIGPRLNKLPKSALIQVMKQNTHLFAGRGRGAEQYAEPYRLLECAEGMVFAIFVTCGGVEFLRAYCRKALIDQWGIHCYDPFVRGSDSTLTHAWAIPMGKDLILYKKTTLELLPEREWMRST